MNRVILTVFVFIVILITSVESGAIMRGLSTEELAADSEVVIEGEVLDVIPQWSSDGSTIFTSVTVSKQDVIKGSDDNENIVVLEHDGGEVGNMGLRVSDEPSFKRGEKVILFLKQGKSKKDGITRNISGRAQGKYTVDEDGIARKKGFSLATGQEVVDNDIPAEELKKKIRGIK